MLHATFFHLDITADDVIWEYKHYDKSHNYPLFIARIPDLSGNVPEYVFLYVPMLPKFLRVAKFLWSSSQNYKVIFANDDASSESSNVTETDKKSNEMTSNCF